MKKNHAIRETRDGTRTARARRNTINRRAQRRMKAQIRAGGGR